MRTCRKTQTRKSYYDRIQRVITYIYDNLDRTLSLEEIANVACLSNYHWHRIYREITGETVQTTIRRLRLLRAAKHLIEKEDPIEKVAKCAGYQDVSSFSRRFRQDYNMSPDQYRQQNKNITHDIRSAILLDPTSSPLSSRIQKMHTVTLQTLPDIQTAAVLHTGSYMQIGRAFEQLFNWAATQDILQADTNYYGIYFNDPAAVAEDQLKSMAAFSTDLPHINHPNIENYVIKGGKYGVLCHTGPYSELENSYRWLYGIWLPENGHEIADLPCYEQYLNNPREVAPSELKTNIYIPLL